MSPPRAWCSETSKQLGLSGPVGFLAHRWPAPSPQVPARELGTGRWPYHLRPTAGIFSWATVRAKGPS